MINTRTDLPFIVDIADYLPADFCGVEVSPVACLPDLLTCQVCAPDDPALSMWSVYLHQPCGMAYWVADFADQAQATTYGAKLTLWGGF